MTSNVLYSAKRCEKNANTEENVSENEIKEVIKNNNINKICLILEFNVYYFIFLSKYITVMKITAFNIFFVGPMSHNSNQKKFCI